MMKDVWISISNRQHDGGKEENTLVFDTAGYYFFDDGVGVLSYQESELTGLEGTRTSVMVMPDQVVVDRDGILTGRMVFRERKDYGKIYWTKIKNCPSFRRGYLWT